MTQFSNPYNSNTKLGGKGKEDAPRHLGDALARENKCSDRKFRKGKKPSTTATMTRWIGKKPPTTATITQWREGGNRHDHGLDMTWQATADRGEPL
jgi:hypothetical protein